MRRRLILAALAAAAVCFASCEKRIAEVPAPEEESVEKVFRASFDDESTKSYLSMNAAGTHADVLWEAGDKIEVIVAHSGGYGHVGCTTQDGGVGEAEFYTSKYNFSNYTYMAAIYPSTMFQVLGLDGNDYMLGLGIPTVQTAVKGGVERGMITSVAYNTDLTSDDLKFKNIYALIKFRLDGSKVGQVSKIRFNANTNISGDCLYYPSTQTFDMGRHFKTGYDGPQSYVELTGPFETGCDYYMAMAPAVSEGFSMQFINSAGDPITKLSDKTLTLTRSRITDFGTLNVEGEFGGLAEGVERYMTHTKGTKPVCIAVIAEAYTAGEQDLFKSRAHAAIDALFETEPYKTYRDYYNVYVMNAVSAESGASKTDGDGNVTEKHDTYFSAQWGASSYGDMNSDSSKAFSFVSARCPEVSSGVVPIKDVGVLMLINDTRYGGICWTWGNGACLAHVPYIYNGTKVSWSHPSKMASSESDPEAAMQTTPQWVYNECGKSTGDWINVVIHEFGGHGLGRLTDEYWGDYEVPSSSEVSSHTWTVPMGLNISGTYDNVPWQTEVIDELSSRWMACTTNPNPYDIYAERVGKFQGAGTYPVGRWRSERISCMIDNRQYFSCWQRMLIVKRIKLLAGETFDLDDFYDKDVPYDPVRDGAKNAAPAWGRIPEKSQVIECPPLPPPVLIETGPLSLSF